MIQQLHLFILIIEVSSVKTTSKVSVTANSVMVFADICKNQSLERKWRCARERTVIIMDAQVEHLPSWISSVTLGRAFPAVAGFRFASASAYAILCDALRPSASSHLSSRSLSNCQLIHRIAINPSTVNNSIELDCPLPLAGFIVPSLNPERHCAFAPRCPSNAELPLRHFRDGRSKQR